MSLPLKKWLKAGKMNWMIMKIIKKVGTFSRAPGRMGEHIVDDNL